MQQGAMYDFLSVSIILKWEQCLLKVTRMLDALQPVKNIEYIAEVYYNLV
jgi:hypothetical protein